MRTERFIVLALMVFMARGAMAQPSDAQIKKDLTAPGVISVTLSKNGGGKVWRQNDVQYYWERGAVIVRDADLKEFPNVKLEIGGFVSYTIIGNTYKFKKFNVTYNSYEGIPNPSEKEVETLLRSHLKETVNEGHFDSIVGDIEKLELAADPKWEWHTPNSVSFNAHAVYEEKVSNTETEKVDRTYEVRLYRDGVKSPWKDNFNSSPRGEKSLGRRTHKADDLEAMKTLGFVTLENKARAELAKLPKVDVPIFNSPIELARFTHKMLMEGDKDKFEAFVTKAAGPGMQAPQSDILFTPQGFDAVSRAMAAAFEGKGKYKDQYCPEPKINRHSDEVIEWANKTGDTYTRVSMSKSGETFKNGEKTGGQYKLADITVWVFQKPDEIARMASYEPGKLCNPAPNDLTLANLGGAVKAAQNAQAAQEHLAQVSKEIEWKPLTNAAAHLSLKFPAEPKLTESKMNDKYPMYSYTAEHSTGLYRAISVVYPVKLNRAQAQVTVDSAIKGFADANAATIKGNSERNEGTYGKSANMEREGGIINMRAFVVGDTLYQLIYVTETANYLMENERAFFDSFKAP